MSRDEQISRMRQLYTRVALPRLRRENRPFWLSGGARGYFIRDLAGYLAEHNGVIDDDDWALLCAKYDLRRVVKLH